MKNDRCLRFLSSLGVIALVGACTRAEAPEKQPSETAKEGAASKAAATQPSKTEGPGTKASDWARTSAEELTTGEQAKLEEAQKAKKALGSTLMGELKAAIGDGDFARGVSACKEAAPTARKKISDEYDVKIGRTSFKVRNPDNAPTGWQKPYVEERVKDDVILTNEAGDLAYMSPIMTAEVCLNCHGTAEQIPDDVEKMLDEKYPEDQATGFAAGDLRGWFWVELAGS